MHSTSTPGESDALRQKAESVYARLNEFFGQPQWTGGEDPVDELIWTILSANTNDTNSGRAFRQLKATFGDDWDVVRTAPLQAIKDAIRTAGMYNQKAPRIVETLTLIKELEGAYNLDHLATMEVPQALAYLTALPGVGHKTASIVLLFCFNRGSFPVDTHIQRISQRLGISGRRDSPREDQGDLGEVAAAGDLLPVTSQPDPAWARNSVARATQSAKYARCRVVCDYYNREGEWAV